MVDSARLGAVVDKGTAWACELVVEGDRGGQAAESGEDSFSEAGEGAGAVALEGEEVFAGPEDRFDPLADLAESGAVLGFVFAVGTDDPRAELVDLGGELAAGVALLAEQRLATATVAALEQYQRDVALVNLGEVSSRARGVPSGARIACNRKPQK